MAKKIVNDPSNAVAEMMEGFISAYSGFYEKVPDVNGVLLKERRKGKVGLIIGGGSGHEPMFSGFVGKGLADAAACGNIFTSPDPGTIMATAEAVDSGKGILFVYGNYAGDNMNFDMAEEFLADMDIKADHVRVWDDCASAPADRIEDRRGIAGDVYVVKIAGAACDAGLELDEVKKVTEKARDNTCSIGVATSPGQIPGTENPTFELPDDEIEYGMGIHGEPGIKRAKLSPADDLVDVMFDELKNNITLNNGDEVCVLINGLGSTTVMEMSIVFRRVKQHLDEMGVIVYDSDINSFCTCMEMGGFSITVIKLDEELKKYYDAPCYSPFYSKIKG